MGEGKGWCAGDLGFEPGISLSHSPTQNPVSSGLATGEGGFTKLNYRQHTHNNGYAFRLAGDPALFQQAAEWVSLERRCCPFVQFTLEWKRDNRVWIAFSGGPGVKDFLAAEIVGAKPAAAPGR